MLSTEIRRLLDGMIDPSRVNFVGVFPRDMEPIDFTRYPSCYVLNTDPSSEPGQHWVAIFITSPNNFEFFDSFAMHPSVYHLSYPNVHCVMDFQAQSFASSVCGHYCVYYLVLRSLAHPPHLISRSFSKFDYNWNDLQVSRFIKKRLHPHYKCTSICPCTQSSKPYCKCH